MIKNNFAELFFVDDVSWANNRFPPGFYIALSTFGILALELALIRWTSTQIRVFAYFNNLVLIAAFWGMGMGVALGRKHPGLVHWTLPALFLLAIPVAFSENLHLVTMPFPDKFISLWGAEKSLEGLVSSFLNLSIFIVLLLLIVLVFLLAGSPVGYLFQKMHPLKAYSLDLIGSLSGIIVFIVLIVFNVGPPVWLAIGSIPFLFISRKSFVWFAFAAILLLGGYSGKGALFSPYNRIDIGRDSGNIGIFVNRDFHQIMFDLSDAGINKIPDLQAKKELRRVRDVYDIPFVINDNRNRALIVGAGTGNDVQGALRNGYRSVYAIDIDGCIMDIGKRLHPEKPYDDARVVRVVNDARAFFEQYKGEKFDVVCYGFLDSHAMFSSMSSLRLDNFVYTEEGIRSAWRHLSKGGHLSVAFSVFGGKWIAERLYWTIAKATGQKPIYLHHGLFYGSTYIVAPDMAKLKYNLLSQPAVTFQDENKYGVRTTSDDWPFLYICPGVFPWGYVIVLSAILIIAFFSMPFVYGVKTIFMEFDLPLFCMGLAFLLIETLGVTNLSLLFGSTWIVNFAVFFSILVMVLIANILVLHFKYKNPLPWFGLLFLSAIFLWAFNMGSLNRFPLLVRGLIGGGINALPIGFAGIIVSIFLSRSKNPSASLSSNLLGSVFGGCIEYFSMCFGLRMLILVALFFYILALSSFYYCNNKAIAKITGY